MLVAAVLLVVVAAQEQKAPSPPSRVASYPLFSDVKSIELVCPDGVLVELGAEEQGEIRRALEANPPSGLPEPADKGVPASGTLGRLFFITLGDGASLWFVDGDVLQNSTTCYTISYVGVDSAGDLIWPYDYDSYSAIGDLWGELVNEHWTPYYERDT